MKHKELIRSFHHDYSLLGAYDLLKSGQFPYPYNQEHVEALLSQAKTLATLISPVFDTATGLPAAQADFSTGKPVQSPTTIDGVEYNVTNCATGGTMILEYSRLSDLTGDESFRRNVCFSPNLYSLRHILID